MHTIVLIVHEDAHCGQVQGHEDAGRGQDHVQEDAHPMAVNDADEPPNNHGDQKALN